MALLKRDPVMTEKRMKLINEIMKLNLRSVGDFDRQKWAVPVRRGMDELTIQLDEDEISFDGSFTEKDPDLQDLRLGEMQELLYLRGVIHHDNGKYDEETVWGVYGLDIRTRDAEEIMSMLKEIIGRVV